MALSLDSVVTNQSLERHFHICFAVTQDVGYDILFVYIIRRSRLHTNMKAAFNFGSGNQASFEPNPSMDKWVDAYRE